MKIRIKTITAIIFIIVGLGLDVFYAFYLFSPERFGFASIAFSGICGGLTGLLLYSIWYNIFGWRQN